MEKVRIDIEVRKLNQLRAVHLNQQHKIRWQLRHLPSRVPASGFDKVRQRRGRLRWVP